MPDKHTVFDFDLPSTLASHLSVVVIMSLLPQLSERLLRVFVHGCTYVACAGRARATWGSMIITTLKWEPRRGAADVAAFSGYSFLLLKKSHSTAGRIPQCLSKKEKKLCQAHKTNSYAFPREIKHTIHTYSRAKARNE